MTSPTSRSSQPWPPIAIGVFGFTVLLGLVVIAYWIWLIARGPETMEPMFDQTEIIVEDPDAPAGPPAPAAP